MNMQCKHDAQNYKIKTSLLIALLLGTRNTWLTVLSTKKHFHFASFNTMHTSSS